MYGHVFKLVANYVQAYGDYPSTYAEPPGPQYPGPATGWFIVSDGSADDLQTGANVSFDVDGNLAINLVWDGSFTKH